MVLTRSTNIGNGQSQGQLLDISIFMDGEYVTTKKVAEFKGVERQRQDEKKTKKKVKKKNYKYKKE
tara:strand:- start:665 stop:862 length:198 start_codon:yes stop_codon:yes gene_type:complete